MKINIPIAPLSVNRAFQGRRFKSSFYKQFEVDFCRTVPRCKKTIKGECEVHYTFYVKNYKMSDVDNCIKTCQDLLVALNYIEDDKQIVFLSAEKIKSEIPHIEVEIIEYEK